MISLAARLVLSLVIAIAVAFRSGPPANSHLRIDGTRFVTSGGGTFQWRGITAFRLIDYVAEGEEARAREYLDWAKARGLTVVRALAILHDGFFDLTAERGRAALPRLLTLAAERGLHVEVVGLTETANSPVDPREHIAALGRIAAQHPNALLELANEPNHPSQSDEVHRPEFLKSIAAGVPDEVPVALGSVEGGDGFGAGDYVTWHVPRETDHDGWGHVLAIADGADLLRRFRKPVVSDEPMGAGRQLEPGRRDDNPDRFRAAALLTRLAGLGSTFHYGAGLHTRIPEGAELASFDAWNEAWTLLPDGIEHRGAFHKAGDAGAAVQGFDRQTALAVFERQDGDRAWVLVVRPGKNPTVGWAPGWSATATKPLGGVLVIEAAQSRAALPE